jgi:hypothetical protein
MLIILLQLASLLLGLGRHLNIIKQLQQVLVSLPVFAVIVRIDLLSTIFMKHLHGEEEEESVARSY